jgi:hypothetical protein
MPKFEFDIVKKAFNELAAGHLVTLSLDQLMGPNP